MNKNDLFVVITIVSFHVFALYMFKGKLSTVHNNKMLTQTGDLNK